MRLFEYEHHPHVEGRQATGPVKTNAPEHVPGGKINTWLASHVTKGVGTMWCAYAFAALALVSLPAAIASGSVIIIVAWIAQTFLQLVLLSIIIVGQNISAEASDHRAEQTYLDAEAVLHEAQQIQLHLLDQDKQLASLISSLGKK